MHNTSLEYYHEGTFLTRLLKQLVTTVSDRIDRLLSTPIAKRQSSDELECGGFNEAFIIQHWASYSPRD
jgi:hypothetical protein